MQYTIIGSPRTKSNFLSNILFNEQYTQNLGEFFNPILIQSKVRNINGIISYDFNSKYILNAFIKDDKIDFLYKLGNLNDEIENRKDLFSKGNYLINTHAKYFTYIQHLIDNYSIILIQRYDLFKQICSYCFCYFYNIWHNFSLESLELPGIMVEKKIFLKIIDHLIEFKNIKNNFKNYQLYFYENLNDPKNYGGISCFKQIKIININEVYKWYNEYRSLIEC